MRWRSYPDCKTVFGEPVRQVPNTWALKPLKRVASLNDEGLAETTDPDSEILYVDISNVDSIGNIHQAQELRFGSAPSRARRCVRDGDTIVSTVRTYLRAIASIRHPPRNLVVSTGFAVVRPTAVVPGFLAYALQEASFVESIVARSVGVSYPAINSSEIATIPIPIPSEEEQVAITGFLDKALERIDLLIAKKGRLIERFDEKRSALISRAVTGGLPLRRAPTARRVPKVRMKHSGISWIGEIPAHWDVKAVKHVATVGNGSTPKRDNPRYWEDGTYPWLTSSVVNQEDAIAAEEHVTPLALAECHLPQLEPPAVLIGITGEGRTRGMVTTLRRPATINQHLAFVKPRGAAVDVAYLRRVFDHAYSHLRQESEGGGSTKGAITCEQIANLRIPVPPAEEQVQIGFFIDAELAAIRALTGRIECAVDRLHEYRSALITAAVTGKIDVRHHSAFLATVVADTGPQGAAW